MDVHEWDKNKLINEQNNVSEWRRNHNKKDLEGACMPQKGNWNRPLIFRCNVFHKMHKAYIFSPGISNWLS